eukprot:jgi/Mesvir1/967/Mv17519-RA.1
MPRRGRHYEKFARRFMDFIVLLLIPIVLCNRSVVAVAGMGADIIVDTSASNIGVAAPEDTVDTPRLSEAKPLSTVNSMLTEWHMALAKSRSAVEGKTARTAVQAGASASQSTSTSKPTPHDDVEADEQAGLDNMMNFILNHAGRSALHSTGSSPSSADAVELRVRGVLTAQAAADAEKIEQELVSVCGMQDVAIVGRGVYGFVPAENVPCLESIAGAISWMPSLLVNEQLRQRRGTSGPAGDDAVSDDLAPSDKARGRALLHQPSYSNPIISQGVKAIGADVVRSRWVGATGRGIKVGIITHSFDPCGITALDQAKGELPAQVQILKDKPSTRCDVDVDWGRALAGFIHDVAPDASIAIYANPTSYADMANGIRQLADAGCDVILNHVEFVDQPMLFGGLEGDAVEEVTRKGVHYFANAGDLADNSYEAPFRPSGTFNVSSRGRTMHLHDFDPSPDPTTFHTSSSTIRGAASAPLLAMPTGAADYRMTPAFNPSLTKAERTPYSAKGGSRIMYDEAGRYLGPAGVVRKNPSIMGPVGTNTHIHTDKDVDNDGIWDYDYTAAGAAHVAGLAALYLSMVKPLGPLPSPAELKQLLEDTADDMGDTAGYDTWTGYGFVNGVRMMEEGLRRLQEKDRQALLAFKAGLDTGVAATVLSDWRDDTSNLCAWTGVMCRTEAPFLVVGLSLVNQGLRGTLSPSLGDLPALVNLDLSRNHLVGAIPASLGSLAHVSTIDLSGNQLQGSIPFSFDRLASSLTSFDVSGNVGVTGCVPYRIAGVTDASNTGVFTHAGRLCGDTITTAIPVSALPFSYSANLADFNRNYAYEAPDCAPAGSTSPDVVFEVTPAADGILLASLCSGTSFDTVVNIVRKTGHMRLVCNDDSPLCSYSTSEAETRVVAGETYYVVLTGKAGASGVFSLMVELAPIPLAVLVERERAALRDFWAALAPLEPSDAGRDWSSVDVCTLPYVTCRRGRVTRFWLSLNTANAQLELTPLMQQPLIADLVWNGYLEQVLIYMTQLSRLNGCKVGALGNIIQLGGVATGLAGLTCGNTAAQPITIPSLPFVYRDDTSTGFVANTQVRACDALAQTVPAVIFKYTAPATALVRISTCLTPVLPTFNRYVYIYNNASSYFQLDGTYTGNATRLCNDDGGCSQRFRSLM